MNGFFKYNSIVNESDEKIQLNEQSYAGFYISYNDCDIDIYGCITTALVIGQMQKFFILKGDHRNQYSELIKGGFNDCFEYFKNNITISHTNSDKI